MLDLTAIVAIKDLSSPAELDSQLSPEFSSPFERPAIVADPIPLQRLRVGQTACIARLLGRRYDVSRMAEMGLRRGAEVTVLRNGITCILQLDGNRLCVRLSKDLVILVDAV